MTFTVDDFEFDDDDFEPLITVDYVKGSDSDISICTYDDGDDEINENLARALWYYNKKYNFFVRKKIISEVATCKNISVSKLASLLLDELGIDFNDYVYNLRILEYNIDDHVTGIKDLAYKYPDEDKYNKIFEIYTSLFDTEVRLIKDLLQEALMKAKFGEMGYNIDFNEMADEARVMIRKRMIKEFKITL